MDIISIIKEAKLLEGDRGQVLIPKSKPVKGDNKAQKMGENPDPEGVITSGEKKAKKLLKKKVSEARSESGKGSASGRASIQNYKKKGHANPVKSRVRIYPSIHKALEKGYVGQKFSTRNADRLYVITKQKWGKDKEHIVNGRVAKGFSPGTIPSSYSDVQGYAIRTMQRYAGASKRKKRRKQK
jgi:hypothetical protein